MSVHIRRVAIEEVGPLANLDLELADFNLIYGRNELGKTFLVEFIIRSLFKNTSGWNLHREEGRGQVWLSGVSEAGARPFKPSSPTKLEDYLEESLSGLPPRISRLLVVKGAELAIDGSDISKGILREFLAGRSLISEIREPIQKRVQQAEVHQGTIEGHSRSLIGDREAIEQEKASIDNLFDAINEQYSGGRRAMLQVELEEAREELAEMERARRHYTYQLNEEIRQLDEQISELSRDELEALREAIANYRRFESELANKEERLADLQDDDKAYRWLVQAIGVYGEREAERTLSANTAWLYGGAVALLLAFGLALTGIYAGALVLGIAGAVALAKYIRDLRCEVRHAPANEELQKLEELFEERFGRPLSGLPLLQQLKEEREEAHHEANLLADQLEKERTRLDGQRAQIVSRLKALAGEELPPEKWESTRARLRGELNRLETKKEQLNTELRDLGVPGSDYLEEPAAVSYSESQLRDLEARAEGLKEELEKENRALDDLKHEICGKINMDFSTPWEQLIHKLQQERAEVARRYRELTAEILAGIAVSDVLDQLSEEEDEKIQESLSSDQVCRPLQALTSRYDGVRLDGERLYVTYPYGEFALNELSTGAQEQVLLALRLGIARKILAQESLFLILDDAFQHADWQRRGWLLQEMVHLAQKGWQITYFTMDDHIRDIFDEVGRERFGEQYVSVDLDALKA